MNSSEVDCRAGPILYDLWFMRPWLARLSFSFFIVAAFLAWHVYRVVHGQAPPQPHAIVFLELVAAVLAVVLGIIGVRERHRPRDEP